ncbi:MAG: hypothetical protein JSU94_01575 [Phycisphaerales bacterium]|nr:MAG: hypothetical protein JSU94_01575 [Phycisphaerales bacterium]
MVLKSVLTLVGVCAAAGGSSFTKEEILSVWRDQEAGLADLYLDFDLVETRTDQNDAVIALKHENITYMAKGSLFRTRKKVLNPKNDTEIYHDWEFSADGKRKYSCYRGASNGSGFVESSPPEKAAIKQSWAVHYLACVYRMPREKDGRTRQCNIISILEDTRTEISEQVLDGRKVVVLTEPNYARTYLDPERNFAVVAGKAEGHPTLTFKFKNSDFAEVAPGIWMPMQTECSFEYGPGYLTSKIKVNELKVNNNYGEEDFRIEFGPGITVHYTDLDLTISPGVLEGIYSDGLLDTTGKAGPMDVTGVNDAPNSPAPAEANAPASKQEDPAAPAPSGVAPKSTAPGLWRWAPAFIALALAALTLAAFRLRRRAPKA